ncbi:MAG TPA: glycosyltransferase family 39 protein [Gaiellaceae bacterium]
MTAAEAIARVRPLTAARWATPALLVALTAVSVVLRTRIIDGGFWIDEGLSVGIAHHPFVDIPGLLKQDGSPPLYYLLLHVWMSSFGDSETATHTLSLLFALACIPAAWWAGATLFGRTTGWICAALAAIDPYLTNYGQETRMYTVLAFLSILATLAYVRGVVDGDKRWLPLLVAALTAMLYTHNWALFYAVALAVATMFFARAHAREALMAGGATLLLFAPWLPTLLDQAQHTGAPWSRAPSLHALLLAPGAVLAGDAPLVAFALAGGIGLATVRRRDIVYALATIVVLTVSLAWLLSQLSPAWATRYFAVVLGPVFLLCAAGVARAARLGVVALVLVLVLWTNSAPKADKSDVREVAALVAPSLRPGDLVISTHPEQTPLVRYYLGGGLRYANLLGPMPDPQLFDWRDAVERLTDARPRATLEPLLASVPPGGRVAVVAPIFRDYRAWRAEWTKLVYRRSLQWQGLIAHDPRFRHTGHFVANEIELEKRFFKPVQADVYVRTAR